MLATFSDNEWWNKNWGVERGLHKHIKDNELALVVGQLAQHLLPMPEVRGSNHVIRFFCIMKTFNANCLKTEIKNKNAGGQLITY